MHYDDGRYYIQASDEKSDIIITSDPIHPWVKGAATLFTEEYRDLVRHRRYPDELFQGSSVWSQALKKAIGPSL